MLCYTKWFTGNLMHKHRLGFFRTSAKQTLEHTSKAVALTTVFFIITQSHQSSFVQQCMYKRMRMKAMKVTTAYWVTDRSWCDLKATVTADTKIITDKLPKTHQKQLDISNKPQQLCPSRLIKYNEHTSIRELHQS